MTENKKLAEIQSIEYYIPPQPCTISTKQKYFITFPYCYMNGKLHLGHLFSISKAEFFSRYQSLKGYNTFFPLAFHCTGMPISASALKLKSENESNKTITNILKDFGIKEDEIHEFIDPQKWLNTFPDLCKTTLQNFHSNIDFSKSFITTERNPYYDSFVRWQFNKLKKLGYLSFGKRYTIYDPILNQPCLDHDRAIGEGVLPVAVDYLKLVVITSDNTFNLCVRKGKKFFDFIMFECGNEVYFTDKACFENVKHQVDDIKEIKEYKVIYKKEKYDVKDTIEKIKGLKLDTDECMELLGDIIKYFSDEEIFNLPEGEVECLDQIDNKKDATLNVTDCIFRFYETGQFVKSRSNATCVVALTDQWFINYCDFNLKAKARKCIESMINLTADFKQNILKALEWIQKWGFSRSFGLGSKIPFDEQYLIDSLSDSTIYMAFYTFKDLLFSDIYGSEEILPKKYLNDDFWEFIFTNDNSIDFENIRVKNIAMSCKERLNYFYPNDVRFSGKDLTNNHLIFFIMNHCALFEENFWPKRIFTNGHLLLNSEKMSKSTGNFMTADQCISLYGVSATRMALCICGDGNDDANFLEETANSFISRLYSLYNSLQIEAFVPKDDSNEYLEAIVLENQLSMTSTCDNQCKNSCKNAFCLSINNSINFKKIESDFYCEKYFYDAIIFNYNNAIQNYENFSFREVMKYAFYEMINVREMYFQIGGSLNTKVIQLWKNMVITLLYPIIPSFCVGLCLKNKDLKRISLKKDDNLIECNYEILKEIEWLKRLIKRIKHTIKKRIPIKIVLGLNDKYSNIKNELIQCNGDINKINELVKEYNGKEKGQLILFARDYYANPANHERVNEERVLNECNEYIMNQFDCDVIVEKSEEGEPCTPKLTITYL